MVEREGPGLDAAAWDERYAERELVWSVEPNVTVADQVSALEPGRALDLAAGEGRNALWLAAGGWAVTAVDFSSVGIDKGRQAAEARGVEATWVVADVTGWDPPGRFDLVLVCFLHLPPEDRRAAHARAAGAVALGGTLLVVGHDADNLDRGYGGPQDPSVLLTVDDVVADAETAGLQVVEAGQVLREVDTDDGPRTAVDTLVRAVRPV